MAQQAAVIFAGEVVGVRRVDGLDGATGVVEIEFAVDDAVRGVSGSTYTLREWAGLWTAGDQSLRAGQHYLMLLHAPSAAGLSSPVGSADGAIPIRGEPAEPALAEPGRGSRAVGGTAVDGRTVDLRWIATRVVRPASNRSASVAHPTALPVPVHAEAMMPTPAQETAPTDGSPAGNGASVDAADALAAQDAGYATVLALLRSWGGNNNATH
jgi:hypothetical protein